MTTITRRLVGTTPSVNIKDWQGSLEGIRYDPQLKMYRASIRRFNYTIQLPPYPNPREAQAARKQTSKAFDEGIRLVKRELAKGRLAKTQSV